MTRAKELATRFPIGFYMTQRFFHHLSAAGGRLLLALLALFLLGGRVSAQTGYTGVFGGGPLYMNAANNINELKNSGFTEVIVWSVEVFSNGDLNFNGEFPLTSNGVYVGGQTHPDFASNMALLKQGTVKRITFSIGSSNFGDFQNIKALVNAQGTGPDSILYKDFAALKAAIPSLDAIDLDDENSYDSVSTIAFSVMLGKLGYKVNPDPYTNSSYWINVVSQINSQLPGTVDGVHLQAYAGGAGNNPCVGWNFGSVPVWPGLWDLNDKPTQVQSIMSNWNSQCGITGGFMWLYDDFDGTGLAAQYASAIKNAVSSSGFTLTGPGTVFINQGATTSATITITDFGGFNGMVNLALSPLPRGVKGLIQGQGNSRKLKLKANSSANTGSTAVTVTGTSGDITQTFTFILTVSSSAGGTGRGSPVDLMSAYSRIGIYVDGTIYPSNGGLDSGGYSYSANLLGNSRVLSGVVFNLGAPNALDALVASGQTINLPSGPYSSLMLLGTGLNGNQTGQTFVVRYTDGSTAQFVQSLSDWFTPQQYAGETLAAGMAYRNSSNGTKDNRPFNLYAYEFVLNPAKTVQSLTLPNNAKLAILSGTVVP